MCGHDADDDGVMMMYSLKRCTFCCWHRLWQFPLTGSFVNTNNMKDERIEYMQVMFMLLWSICTISTVASFMHLQRLCGDNSASVRRPLQPLHPVHRDARLQEADPEADHQHQLRDQKPHRRLQQVLNKYIYCLQHIFDIWSDVNICK